jgi:STE24 endopeptidase
MRADRSTVSSAWRLAWTSLMMAMGVAGSSGCAACRGYDSRVSRRITRRLSRPAAIAAAAALGAGGVVAILRWRLWSGPVPAPLPVELSDHFDAAELARNREYRRGVWAMAAAAVPIAPAAAIGAALLGRHWRPAVVRLARGRPWRAGVVFGAGLAVALAAVALPLGIARYSWGRRYGLVTQSVGSWLADVGKAALIEAIVFGLVGLVLAVLLFRAPRLWWAGLAVLVAVLVYGLSLASPLVLEPLFQKTTPLTDRALATEVLDIAEKSGVQAQDVKVTDASSRTTAANAYVSGLGASRHVVLYDTLLRDFPRDQVRMVVAHELAHVAKGHVAKGTTWGAALAAPLCLGLFALVGWRTGWGRPSDDADGADLVLRRLALVAAGAITLAAVSTPAGGAISRAYEREAEWSALQVTGDADAAIGLQKGFVKQNLSVPDPPAWVRFWFGTHPTALERIGMAQRLRQ